MPDALEGSKTLHLSFKQQNYIPYHGRDTAIMRAYYANIPIILGSATPSLESLVNAERGRFVHVRLKQRAGHAQSQEYQVIDVLCLIAHH